MKKILSILLTVILSLCCFAACGEDDPFLNGGGSTGGSMSSDTGSSDTGSSDTGGASGGDAVATYTITYNLNGGKNDSKNPTTYNVESGSITLQAPTQNGYKFLELADLS